MYVNSEFNVTAGALEARTYSSHPLMKVACTLNVGLIKNWKQLFLTKVFAATSAEAKYKLQNHTCAAALHACLCCASIKFPLCLRYGTLKFRSIRASRR